MISNKLIKEDFKSIHKNKCLTSPRVMQIEITNICTLNCPQCYKPPVHQLKSMTFEEFKRHIDEAVVIGVKELSILGGEPFENKNIIEMIEYATSLDLQAMAVTNGCRIKKNLIDRLKLVGDRFTLLLSLNGSSEKINEKSRDGYKITIHAAQKLKENNYPFGINWVARHDNVMDLSDMISLSARIGAKFLNIVCNKLTGHLEVNSPLIDGDYEALLDTIKREQKEKPGFVTIQKCFDVLVKQALNVPRSILSGCQAGISVCAVTLDNEYMPCMHLMYPEKFDSIAEYWKNSEILKKLRMKKTYNTGYCTGCIYFKDCKYCRAMSLESHIDFNSGLRDCGFKKRGEQYETVRL